MSTLTKNYGLEKPAQDDFYNVDVFNANADTIDEELSKSVKGEGLEFSVVNNILNATHESGATAQVADKPTVDEIVALLENTAYGLNALKSLISNNVVDLTPVTSRLDNTTYGLSAIKTAINGRASESTLTATKALLENTTYGLSAIKSTVGLGCVKSVQRGIITQGTITSTYVADNFIRNGELSYYVDVSLNNVNMNKTFVAVDTHSDATSYNNNYVGVLTGSTNLRIYVRSANGVASSGTTLSGGVAWQVIEFY